MRIQGALRTVSWLLDSEKPGGLGNSPRGALSLSVKSIAHGLPITRRRLPAAALLYNLKLLRAGLTDVDEIK